MTETVKAVILSIPKILFSKKGIRTIEQVKESAVKTNDTERTVQVAGRILYDEIRQNQLDTQYITELFLKLDRAEKIPCGFLQSVKSKRYHRLIATRFFEVICDKIMNEEIKL